MIIDQMMIRSPTLNDEGFGSGPRKAFGGALITGGSGRYLGMLGGVLFLTALLQMLLAGTTLPYATKAISLRAGRSQGLHGAARTAAAMKRTGR
nr:MULTISPECIES: hypothetical protein [Mesorhizobium]